MLRLGADDVDDLVWMITCAGVAFILVDGPNELAEALRRHAERLLAAVERT